MNLYYKFLIIIFRQCIKSTFHIVIKKQESESKSSHVVRKGQGSHPLSPPSPYPLQPFSVNYVIW